MKSLKLTTLLFLLTFWLYGKTTGESLLASKGAPLAELLNSDGTINLQTGFTGSLNLAGFDIYMDECMGIIATPKHMTTTCEELDETLTPNSWSSLGLGVNDNVYAIAVSEGTVVVGGRFTSAGGQSANRIAKWDGTNWSALGTGLDGDCLSLAYWQGDLYVGGRFTTAGGTSDRGIAKWDGTNWSSIGSGLSKHGSYNGVCYAIATSETHLYITGAFRQINDLPIQYVAKWDGTSWTSLGAGINGIGFAIAVSGEDVYVGGTFTGAGDISTNNIAKWDGTSWSALGAGLDEKCRAIAIMGDDVFVGGDFAMAGDQPANYIAKWDGSTWSPMGTGLRNYCRAIAVVNDNVYVVGDFSQSAVTANNQLIKWNGTNWSTVSPGVYVTSSCEAITPDGNNFYVGGVIGRVAGILVNNIVKWEGEPTALQQHCATCQEGLTLLKDNMYKYPEKANTANNGKLPWTEVYADFRDNYLPACNEVGTYAKANNTPAMSTIYQTATVDNWDKLFQSHVGIITHASRIPAYCPGAHRSQYDCVEASRRMLQYSIPAVESIINLVK